MSPSKVWLIAREEYVRNVFRRSFILVLLSLPLMLSLNIGVGVLINRLESDDRPLGFIDHAGVILQDHLPDSLLDKPVDFLRFENAESARDSLDADEIQAFYILSVDYVDSGNVELVFNEEPASNATRQFGDLLQFNLAAQKDEDIQFRLTDGTEFMLQIPGDSRTVSESGPGVNFLIPLFIAIGMIALLLMSSGFLMEGMVKERENQTLEVIVTSTSARDLVLGKVVGILGISLTQLVSWVFITSLVLWLGQDIFAMAILDDLQFSLKDVLPILGVAVPSFIMAAGLLFALGTTIATNQDAQSYGGFAFLLYILPVFGILAIGPDPNSVVGVILTLAPITSLMTVALRSVFVTIPLWQIYASIGVQSLFALLALWIATKAFRVELLQFGGNLSLPSILRAGSRSKSEEGIV